MDNSVIVIFKNYTNGYQADLEVPLDISANELVVGLNQAFSLGIDTSNIQDCYLQSENPIALLKGVKSLGDFHIRNGSIIIFTER